MVKERWRKRKCWWSERKKKERKKEKVEETEPQDRRVANGFTTGYPGRNMYGFGTRPVFLADLKIGSGAVFDSLSEPKLGYESIFSSAGDFEQSDIHLQGAKE